MHSSTACLLEISSSSIWIAQPSERPITSSPVLLPKAKDLIAGGCPSGWNRNNPVGLSLLMASVW